jgi:hypothetical protein
MAMDRSRQDRGRQPERGWERELGRYDTRAEKMRANEKRNGGHTFREHVDVGPADTAQRARIGKRARGGIDTRNIRDATRWTSERAAARAAERLWRDPQTQRRLASEMARYRAGAPVASMHVGARMPLHDAVGGNWRKHVAGHSVTSRGMVESRFTERSQAVGHWLMNDQGQWYLDTCFPQVTPPPQHN